MGTNSPDYMRAYRKRRKEEGRPLRGGKADPLLRAQYAAEYQRAHMDRLVQRARMRRADPQHLQRVQARRKVRYEVEMGRLLRLPCARCGAARSEAHHSAYSLPLAVEWLCRPCHRRLHREGTDVHAG